MKVLLVSEGKHELGNEFRDQSIAALRTLVSRVIGHHIDCDFDTVRNVAFHATHGKGDRFRRKAIRCMEEAHRRGYHAIILVIDEDDDPDRRRQFDLAQDHVSVGIPRALGIAIKTFDAWMLADETALSKVLGTTVQRQPDPEEIRDAKAHCQRLRAELSPGRGLTEMYEQVAQIADIAVIEKRCPRGFGTFAARVRRLQK